MVSIKKVFVHPIEQIFLIYFLIITLSLLSAFGQLQKNQEAQPLHASRRISRELAGGETHKYLIKLKTNEFLQIRAEQKGVDVVVRLLDSSQKQLAEMDSPNGTAGFEELLFITEKAGAYEIHISALDEKAVIGKYTLQWTAGKTTEKDKMLLQAQKLIREATVLYEQKTRESYRAALEKSERAQILYKKLKDKPNEANALSSMFSIYFEIGEEYQRTLEINNQLLTIYKALGDKNGEARTLHNTGAVYMNKGEHQKALEYNNQALLIERTIGDKLSESNTLQLIGLVYENLGENQKALDYYNQSLPIYRAIGDKRWEGSVLGSIGSIYTKLGEYQKALDYFNQALNINKSLRDDLSVASSLFGIGTVYFKLEENQKALDYYNQVLAIYKNAIAKSFLQSGMLAAIGEVYFKLGENQKALDYYNQSLQGYAPVDVKGKAFTLGLLQNIWQSIGNFCLAAFYGKQSVNKYQELRQLIKGLDKETQRTFLKTIESTYRKLVDILISEGRFPEAQVVLDLLKEEEFKQIVRRSGEPLFTLPYSKSELDAIGIVDRLAALGRELSELKAKPKDTLTAEETARLNYLEQTEIPAANKALRLSTEALAKAAPDVKEALVLKMKDNIQTILPALGKGVVALYTVVGKTNADENAENKIASNNKINVGWILLVTPEFRKAYPIDTKDLEQTVFKFRESLRSSQYDPQPLAAELYKKLFLQTSDKQKTTLAADLETYLDKQKDKTLMWSLDGVLRYVPMAALHDGKGYLVEKYRNVVFNTASLGSLKDSPKPNWEVVGLGVSTEGTVKSSDGRMLRFSALKGSESELNSIIKEKNRAGDDGIFSGTLKINKDFTKEALFEGARTGMPVMHISSHFYFNTAQEETSFLLLGNGERLEMTEFQDYPNLFSNVDFLSLSACDTATGGNAVNSSAATEKADIEQKAREANGKEIEGFAYRAQTLGAKSVMASLWQVSDIGTKELMLKFYQIRKEQPELPKGEALRQAQLSLLHGTNKAQDAKSEEKGVEEQTPKSVKGLKPFKRDETTPFAHPYYWSSFILIGNWQ